MNEKRQMPPNLSVIPPEIQSAMDSSTRNMVVVRDWLEAQFGRLRGKPFTFFDANDVDKDEFIRWLNVQSYSVDGFNTVTFKERHHFPFFLHFSDKVGRLAQRGCLICEWGQTHLGKTYLIPIRFKPVSRQNIGGDDWQAMQRGFADRLKRLKGEIGKDARLCIALTFVLSPAFGTSDKDLDNMAKASMDAISRAIEFNDLHVHHLDLAKIILPAGCEQYLYVRIAHSRLNNHPENTLVLQQQHSWAGMEPIELSDWM